MKGNIKKDIIEILEEYSFTIQITLINIKNNLMFTSSEDKFLLEQQQERINKKLMMINNIIEVLKNEKI